MVFEGAVDTADAVDAIAESIEDPHAVAAIRAGGRRPEPMVLRGKHPEEFVSAGCLQSDADHLLLCRQAPLQSLGSTAGFHQRVARSLRIVMVHLAIQGISPQQARLVGPHILGDFRSRDRLEQRPRIGYRLGLCTARVDTQRPTRRCAQLRARPRTAPAGQRPTHRGREHQPQSPSVHAASITRVARRAGQRASNAVGMQIDELARRFSERGSSAGGGLPARGSGDDQAVLPDSDPGGRRLGPRTMTFASRSTTARWCSPAPAPRSTMTDRASTCGRRRWWRPSGGCLPPSRRRTKVKLAPPRPDARRRRRAKTTTTKWPPELRPRRSPPAPRSSAALALTRRRRSAGTAVPAPGLGDLVLPQWGRPFDAPVAARVGAARGDPLRRRSGQDPPERRADGLAADAGGKEEGRFRQGQGGGGARAGPGAVAGRARPPGAAPASGGGGADG